MAGPADTARWPSPRARAWHFRKHGAALGVRTEAEYDASARATIRAGQRIAYCLADGTARVGYWQRAPRRFTALTADERLILTHFRPTRADYGPRLARGGAREEAVMAEPSAHARDTWALLRHLLAERGLLPGEYALFFVVGEGELPGGGEALSGYVLDRRGRVHAFWLTADPGSGRPVLEWEPEEPAPEWAAAAEYQRARAAVGLA